MTKLSITLGYKEPSKEQSVKLNIEEQKYVETYL